MHREYTYMLTTSCRVTGLVHQGSQPDRGRKVDDQLASGADNAGKTADTDGGAYSPFRSILLVLTHDFIIIQLYGPACGDG